MRKSAYPFPCSEQIATEKLKACLENALGGTIFSGGGGAKQTNKLTN